MDPSGVDLEIVRKWLTKPHIYDIGSHMGCACPFADDSGWDNPTEEDLKNREDFRQLAAYLEIAVAVAGPIELYNADEYWNPPEHRRAISIQDLLGDRFVFEERELVLVRNAESSPHE
jgi:hypothetical protein